MATDNDSTISALRMAQNNVDNITQFWTPELVQFLTIGVLGFSCIALIMATILLWRSSAPPHQILRVFGVICILTFSALLLVVGYSDTQLTPIVGLFGAIAGYLLGKDSKNNNDE